MASAIFNRNHVASTQDEKAIERGFSSSVGLLGGIGVALTAALLLGANQAVISATVLLFLSAVPLGIIGANRFLTSEAPQLPVLEMMRYSVVTLPIILMTELLFGGHALGLLGDFVGSVQMFGPRFVLSLVAAGFAHALACRVVWDDEDRARETTVSRPNVDWQSRYVEARTRLATTTVDLKRRREAEEDALAEFDRKLAAMASRGEEEWVLEQGAQVEIEQEEPAVELA